MFRVLKLYDVIRKVFVGGLMGIGIGYIITVCFSIKFGIFLPAPKSLVDDVGTLNASIMLLVYSTLIGASFKASEFIWHIRTLNLMFKSLLYYMINLIIMIFASCKMHWINMSLSELISFVLVFSVIFMSIWIINYIKIKKNIEKLNKNIRNS